MDKANMSYKFCYVILHYISLDETINCIEHILTLDGENTIVVVDNASPNGSGIDLQEKYIDNKKIEIIINDENKGFAVGNNIGCKYAITRFSPDFIVVLNNDVQINQKSFQEVISSFYKENRFDVLGPDIYSTTLNVHQNPKRKNGYTYDELKKLVKKYKKKLNNDVVMRLQSIARKNKALKKIVNQVRTQIKRGDYSEIRWGVMLHGACLVFSKDFFVNRAKCFFDRTFMYFEAEILQYELERDDKLSVYCPNVRVDHHQNISTDLAFRKSYEQLLFKHVNMYQSLLAFKTYMEHDRFPRL